MHNVMIDIEALGLRAGAAVIELAAVAFDPATGATGAEFHCRIKPVAPFLCDYETILWHGRQGTLVEHPDAIMPAAAVERFLEWLEGAVPDRKERVLWSWGSDYDFPLLAPLLDRRPAGTEEPWWFSQTRCARTIWKVAFGAMKPAPRPHRALDDVRAAIGDLVMALAELSRPRA